jgi:TonB family protein
MPQKGLSMPSRPASIPAAHRFAAQAAVIAAVALSASSLALASRVVERPGVGYAPAFVCIETTVMADGNTKQSSILRRSGNAAADRNSLRFVRTLKFRAPEGTTWEAMGVGERTAHVLVRMHQNGQMAFKLCELTEPLPAICHSPFESVERDRAINATSENETNA